MIFSVPRTLLAIEDNAGDARLLREMLNDEGGHATDFLHASSMAEAEQLLRDYTVDIIVLDLGLPDVQGLDAVRRARAAAPRLPLVVLTGLDDEKIAGHALQEGAQDYIIKGQVDLRGLLRALRNAMERKGMEDTARDLALQIDYAAKHDNLTGLPNRVLLKDRIDFDIEQARRHNTKLALMFLDLDGFKHVNDSLGHSTGDKLLKSISDRLLNCVRSVDTVSRHGGDEFIILLSGMTQADEAIVAASRILEAVAKVHRINEHDLHITASVGISIYPDDGDNAETLMKNADTAMYQAKNKGRQTYLFFKPTMNQKAVERQSLESDLRHAIERHEFELYYQPKIDLETGLINGAEALLRWLHPSRGFICPSQFIPIAEDCRLILPIGNWVLHEACQQTQRWASAGLLFGSIAVNLSAVQFSQEDFASSVFAILNETGLNPSLLELELTESVLMTGAGSIAVTLQALRHAGVQIALDDFGTGYSSLSYLQKFPVDTLKIDQSFIRQISILGANKTLVAVMINMAHTLGLKVVAEGIETEEELSFLRDHRCDEGQGYLFSKPLSAPNFAQYLSATMSTL